MKNYSILYAEDVPHYATHYIEAENDAAAIEVARQFDWSGLPSDPDHHSSTCRRIVSIENDDIGDAIAEDIPLDEWFLCEGLERQRLYNVAPDILEALRTIAAIPMFGEPLPASMGDVKPELIEDGEYDEENQIYTPTVDTESSQLQHAVEIARNVIAKTEGGAR